MVDVSFCREFDDYVWMLLIHRSWMLGQSMLERSGTAPTVFCWYIASTFSEARGLSSLNIISNQVETLLTKCLCLGPEGGHGLTTTKSCSSYFLWCELTMQC